MINPWEFRWFCGTPFCMGSGMFSPQDVGRRTSLEDLHQSSGRIRWDTWRLVLGWNPGIRTIQTQESEFLYVLICFHLPWNFDEFSWAGKGKHLWKTMFSVCLSLPVGDGDPNDFHIRKVEPSGIFEIKILGMRLNNCWTCIDNHRHIWVGCQWQHYCLLCWTVGLPKPIMAPFCLERWCTMAPWVAQDGFPRRSRHQRLHRRGLVRKSLHGSARCHSAFFMVDFPGHVRLECMFVGKTW